MWLSNFYSLTFTFVLLVLASQSPRRRRFLEEAALEFTCDPANGAENPWDGIMSPHDHVKALALAKATEVTRRHPGDLVLAADTVVVKDSIIFGKPRDLADANRMLRTLSGGSHQVLTGVALCRDNGCIRAWVSSSVVHFRALTDADINQYCKLVNVLDKAGAYGIQEHGDLIVEGIDGLWSNVVGLPIEEVLNELRENDVHPFHWEFS